MQLVKFKDYAEYVRAQTETNRRKLACVWATGRDIDAVAAYIRRNVPDPRFGLCHGVRNGWEVRRFKSRLPGVQVIGTEISDTADQFEDVIQWDFHEVKEEWIGNVDFIYSNSWDHSYDPQHCLDQWMRCIKPTGRCFIEWSAASNENVTNGADCFSATDEEYRAIFERRYRVEDVIEIPGSALKRAAKRMKLTRMVSIGMPKKIFAIRHREGEDGGTVGR